MAGNANIVIWISHRSMVGSDTNYRSVGRIHRIAEILGHKFSLGEIAGWDGSQCIIAGKVHPKVPDSWSFKTRPTVKWVGLPVSTSGQLLGSVRFHSIQASLGGHKERAVEKLWREFFSDPSQWWDHRCEKVNPRFPDFKHKQRHRGALWLNSPLKPTWVETELATIAPRTLQMSVFSWNKRLARYCRAGQYKKTIEGFQQMQGEGINPDKFSFSQVLTACANATALQEGRRAHEQIIQRGYESDVFLGSSLVNMYAKCGSIDDAWRVFNNLPTRDAVTWTIMIMGCVKCGQGQKGLKVFQQMQMEGVEPDHVTYVAVLNACASVSALDEGRHAHEQIIQKGYNADTILSNCLVDMYAKCGSIEDAWRVFKEMPTKDAVSWTSMILGYVKCGQGHKALQLSQEMLEGELDLNSVSFVAVLNACTSVSALENGRRAHEQIIQRGYESNVFVSNCLVEMYAKCGSIEDAQRVFNKMPKTDVMAWTALILGYVNCGQGQKALNLCQQMHDEGVDPDLVSFVAVLNTCASMAALEEGRRTHEHIIQKGYESNLVVGNCLIDMYAKCGSLEDAWRVFNKMPTRDVVSWSAILASYSRHGYAREAVVHFERMCKNVEVDRITFISLLSACSHGGFVDDGLDYFESMNTVYNVSPTVEHYACVVDLLGRAGRLHEAEDLIRTIEPDASVWMSLVSACRAHGNVQIGEYSAKRYLELDPKNSAGYLLLSNMYAATGKWDSSASVHQ